MVKLFGKVSGAKVGFFTKIEKVKSAHGYSTAWDSANDSFRIIGPKGDAYSFIFNSRKMAESYAVTMAKMTFAKNDAQHALDRARAILSNDLIEEIGEDRLFEGPLYEREGCNEEAD